jgi:subtilisin-like proprotein convertase family protein
MAQDAWTRTVSSGFGYPSNSTVFQMNVFNNELYAATGMDSGYVYKSSTGNPYTWAKVFSDPISVSVNAITSTTEGGGNIYISSRSNYPDTSRILRSTDGINWSTYYLSSYFVTNIIPFKGTGSTDSIYITENGFMMKSHYNSADPLNAGGAWDTVFNLDAISPGALINVMAKHGSKLFFGTSDGDLYSSADGNNWVANANASGGFGDPNNNSITAIASFGGYIYVAVENSTVGAQVWRSSDETNWTMVQQLSYSHARISSLNVADGKLWICAVSNSSAALISYSSNGTTFTVSNNNGFGDPYMHGYYGAITGFGNNVYYSGEYDSGGGKRAFGVGGAEIWRKCTIAPPVVNLGPDQSVCYGASVTLDAGPSGNGYYWSNEATTQSTSVISPGTFFVQFVSANGCSDMDTININSVAGPSITMINPSQGITTICSGTSVNVNATAISNVYFPDPPIHKTTNDSISDLLGGYVYDTINVSGLSSTCACDALMSVTIDSLYHTYSADLDIGIYTPTGSYITLSQSIGSDENNTYFGTEFRMDAGQYIGSAGTPFTGQFVPQGDFRTLLGNPNGGWVLSVQDHIGGDDGRLKGWTIRFKVDDTVMTYSWTPTTGVTSTNTLNTVITPTVSTTYTLTTTNNNGCVTQTPVDFLVPQLTFAQAADTMCFGSSITLTVMGGKPSTTWSPSADLNTNQGSEVIASPSVSTEYFVVDTLSGCPLMDSIFVHANTQMILTSPAPVTICFADTASLTAGVSGGSAPYVYTWDMGGSYLYGETVNTSPVGGTSYTISATDAAGCFVGGGSTSVSVTPSTDIYGSVTYTGGTVNSSSVVLYKYEPYLTNFDTIGVATTDASGNYYFPSVNHSDYLIKVFPNASYTTLVPTYFGNVFLWDSATIVTHDCMMNDTFNIVTVEELGSTGPGYLQGIVLEDMGFGRVPGDPIPGVDVKLGRNPGGALVTSTTTDGNGVYSFSNVAFGDYTVYADIPGLGRDSSYTFTVDSTNDSYLNLDYYVDSTVVFIVNNITTGTVNNLTAQSAANTFSVYPNPANGFASVEYIITNDAVISLGVYNVLGVKVIDLAEEKQMAGTYKYKINNEGHSRLTNGVYFVSLSINGKSSILRLVINE